MNNNEVSKLVFIQTAAVLFYDYPLGGLFTIYLFLMKTVVIDGNLVFFQNNLLEDAVLII